MQQLTYVNPWYPRSALAEIDYFILGTNQLPDGKHQSLRVTSLLPPYAATYDTLLDAVSAELGPLDDVKQYNHVGPQANSVAEDTALLKDILLSRDINIVLLDTKITMDGGPQYEDHASLYYNAAHPNLAQWIYIWRMRFPAEGAMLYYTVSHPCTATQRTNAFEPHNYYHFPVLT
jgi:hypothetical protein